MMSGIAEEIVEERLDGGLRVRSAKLEKDYGNYFGALMMAPPYSGNRKAPASAVPTFCGGPLTLPSNEVRHGLSVKFASFSWNGASLRGAAA